MNDKYDFLKEQVKKQKPYKKWLKRAGAAIFSAVIFSLVFMLLMVFVYPRLDGLVNGKDGRQVALGSSSQIVKEEQQSGLVVEQSSAEESSQSTASEIVQSESAQNEPDIEDTEASYLTSEPEETTAEQIAKVSVDIMEVAEHVKNSMVTVIGITEDKDWFNQTYENQGQLSGLIIAEQNTAYYVLTEYSVVKDVKRIMVTFAGGQTAEAHFVKHDSATGLCVLRVNTNDVPKDAKETIVPVKMSRHNLAKQGEAVIAIGSPAGYAQAVVVGRITSVDHLKYVTDNAYHIIYTDIDASKGGSGILVDLNGGVVGIMAQQLLDTRELGMMTCLSLSELVYPLEKLCNNEQVVYMGINGQDISAAVSEKTGIPMGIWVDSVDKDSPAMEVGILAGDVIVKIEEAEVSTLRLFHSLLNYKTPGETINITVMRRGVEGYVEVPFKVKVSGR